MHKKIIFIAATLFLLAIAGCDGSKKDQRPISEVDIRKGTDGLKMEFLPNAPPKNVFAESGFPISLKLKNAGASDIYDGLVALGFEKAYIDLLGSILNLPKRLSGEEAQALIDGGIKFHEDGSLKIEKIGEEEYLLNPDGTKTNAIEVIDIFTTLRSNIDDIYIGGKKIFNPLGSEYFINANAWTKKIGAQSETYPTAIFATACYPYETVLGTSACIDTDILGQRKGQKACTVRDLIFSEGQGAPVVITKVETRMLPADDNKIKPHFLIHVKNAGNGEVVNKSSFAKACNSEKLGYKDFFNKIIVSASLSGASLECNGEKTNYGTIVKLKDKEDLIRCTYEQDGGISTSMDAYAAPLRIELDYGYTFTISKDIIIEKVLTH